MSTTSKKPVKKAAKKPVKTQSITGYKAVTAKLKSFYDPSFQYEIGKTVEVLTAKRGSNACGDGIHYSKDLLYPISFASQFGCYKPGKDFKVLKLRINKSDIMASNAEKSRARKAFVVGEVSVALPDYKPVTQEIKSLGEKDKIKKLSCQSTNVQIKDLFRKFTSANKLTGHIIHLISNPFEAEWYANNASNSYYADDHLDDHSCTAAIRDIARKYSSLLDDYNGNIFSAIECILRCYASNQGSINATVPGKPVLDTSAMVEMLKLGVIPLGQKKKEVYVFIPSTTPDKWFPNFHKFNKNY